MNNKNINFKNYNDIYLSIYFKKLIFDYIAFILCS